MRYTGNLPGPLDWDTGALNAELHTMSEALSFTANSGCIQLAPDPNQNTDPKVAGSNPFIAVPGQELCKQHIVHEYVVYGSSETYDVDFWYVTQSFFFSYKT